MTLEVCLGRGVSLGFLACLAAVSLTAQSSQPNETLPGFKAESVLEARGIDNVSPFTGDPGVVLPLGPEYTLSSAFKWQLKAYYSVKFWTMTELGTCPYDDLDNPQIRYAYVLGDPTLGVGWGLQLGYVGQTSDSLAYFSPDGGRHEVDATGLTADGSHLRITWIVTPPSYKVEFPDGTIEYFEQPFSAPGPAYANPPLYGKDFNNLSGYHQTESQRYGLKRVVDRFGNLVLKVIYDSSRPSQATSIILNPDVNGQGPTVTLHWSQTSGTSVKWWVVDYVLFSGVGSQQRKVSFIYQLSSFTRNVYDTSHFGGNPNCDALPPTVPDAPRLHTATFSDANGTSFTSFSYAFDYADYPGTGELLKITLPTQGTIQYTYGPTTGALCGIPGCDPETSGPIPELEAPGNIRPFKAYLDNSRAVAIRTETDTATNTIATRTYTRLLTFNCTQSCTVAVDNTLYRRVTVVAPGNDPGPTNFATRSVFKIGVPGPPPPDLFNGVEVDRRYYSGSSATGTPVRTTIRCYGHSYVVCGYRNASGLLQTYSTGLEPPQAEVTWYGAVPSNKDGGSCTGSSPPCIALTSPNPATDYNATVGEYKTKVLSSTLTGVPSGWSRTTTTNWNPQSGTKWMLDIISSKTAADASTPAPASVTTSLDVNLANGFVKTDTTSDGYGTLTHTYYNNGDVNGNGNGNATPVTASGSGAGLTGSFTNNRTFQSGLAMTDQRSGISWKSFNVVRDTNTGLITSSYDPNTTALPTYYSYDALGRLKTITPPGGEAPATISYDSTTQTTVSRSGSDGNATWQRYIYDSLGRLIREIRQMPSGYAVRVHSFDTAGHAAFASEWGSCSSIQPGGNCLTGAAPAGTISSNFDPFGRAQRITKADSTQITINRTDGTIAFSDSLESVQMTVGSSSSTTVTRRDALGRIITVTEPSVGQGAEDTTYMYNVLDKLASVTQGVQSRTFVYDVFGFLRSESTPEKGPVCYNFYDALGDALERREGGGACPTASGAVVHSFTYDAAARLVRENAGGIKYLVNCYDGSGSCADGSANSPGGSYPAGKLTRRYGYNYIPYVGPVVDESFEYSNSTGRLSKLTAAAGNGDLSAAAIQTWSYNSLGLASSRTNPRVSGSFPVSMSYSAGLPASVAANSQNVVTAVSYSPSLALASWTAGSSPAVVTTITPDASLLPRPSRIKAVAGATTLFDTGSYGYDGAGNILSIGTGDSFTYDARSRLTQVGYGGQIRSFSLDRWGNLDPDGAGPIGVDASHNRLTGTGISYDSRGNQTSYSTDTLRYDSFNRQYRHANTTSDWIYLFNGAGERLVKFPAGFLVLRREMARYIAEGNIKAQKPGWTLPGSCTQYFTDVPCTDPDALYVQLVKEQGITAGCGGGLYCPDTPITRAQMAVFLVLGYKPSGYSPPACTGVFQDVTCGGPYAAYAKWIEQLYRDGVTAGCGTNPLTFCPSSNIGEWETLAWMSAAPTTPPSGSKFWAAYNPVPRGSVYTWRDEQNRVVTEMAAGGSGSSSATLSVSRDNVFLGNLLVASYASSAWEYYVSDHLGSPRAAWNQAAASTAQHKYWPYGEEVSPGVVAQRVTFATMERDVETSHFYDHARQHDFNLGRFLSIDQLRGTVVRPQSWNRYVYALDNPTNIVDSTGLDPDDTYRVPPCATNPGGCPQRTGTATESITVTVPQDEAEAGRTRERQMATGMLRHLRMQQWEQQYRIAELALPLGMTPILPSISAFRGIVIGKMGDLEAPGALRFGERTLLPQLVPDLGAGNWARNEKVLLEAMEEGMPIRDASINPVTGELINNTGFLARERGVLLEHGWSFEKSVGKWVPPWERFF